MKLIIKDERGIWSLPLVFFFLITIIPFIVFRADIGNARHARDELYTAVDAASLAGAQQYDQQVTGTNSYGEPTSWIFVVDEARAQDHGSQVLFDNLNNYPALSLQSYAITYPDAEHCRVDATVKYNLPNVSKAVQLFLGDNQAFAVTLRVHATASVVQPTPP